MKRTYLLVGLLLTITLIAAACTPQTVEVTRVVSETVMEQVEVTRVITETIEVEGEPVEVTRIVEVAVESEETFPEGTELSFLQWSHFVPNYDTWFDQFATEWGEANGVQVTVDHVNIADVAPALSAAIDAGQGPTLVELSLAASLFIEGVHDLTDLNMRAQELFGPQAETCTANSYLPTTDTWYGYCHGWVPDPGDYDIEMWTQVGMPDGPETWDDLLEGGSAIYEQLGVPLGIGLSPEIDSNMAMRALIWSFGGSVQDENECVVINSPEVIEATEFLVELYNNTMTEEVFSWDAASNNQGLIAGELSYILNSISAYRSLQKIDPEAADNIGFVPALIGPRGDQHASAHLWYIYVIPSYVDRDSPEYRAAEEFLIYHTANYNQAVFNSELYNFPAFESTVPQLQGWVENDPFGSRPIDKLTVLATAEDWVTYLGYPGPSNPAVAEVYSTNIIPTMMGQAALGELTPEEAVAQAEEQINDIFDKWRDRGFVGCVE
ncbi:MAG TPA: extracellular solute-binding protein [Candidatus Sulfomarinibacteraceae bacterium]|nr:extracellular solute-binding protein [Candidatus Sulfomarinibacteraceae bacterium]